MSNSVTLSIGISDLACANLNSWSFLQCSFPTKATIAMLTTYPSICSDPNSECTLKFVLSLISTSYLKESPIGSIFKWSPCLDNFSPLFCSHLWFSWATTPLIVLLMSSAKWSFCFCPHSLLVVASYPFKTNQTISLLCTEKSKSSWGLTLLYRTCYALTSPALSYLLLLKLIR